MKKKILILLAITCLALLILCSCTDQKCYENEIKTLEEAGFAVVGDTEDAKVYIFNLFKTACEELANSMSGTGSSSTDTSEDFPLVPDPYATEPTIDEIVSDTENNSSLVTDPEEWVEFNGSIVTPENLYTGGYFSNPQVNIIVGTDPSGMLLLVNWQVSLDDISQAVLMKNEKGDFAVVALFSSESSATSFSQLSNLIPNHFSLLFKPAFGSYKTVAFGPSDTLKDFYLSKGIAIEG